MSLPSSRMRPSSGVSKPASIRNSVVLPQPLGPSSAKNSPARMSSDKRSTARKLPNFFTTASMRSSGMSGAGAGGGAGAGFTASGGASACGSGVVGSSAIFLASPNGGGTLAAEIDDAQWQIQSPQPSSDSHCRMAAASIAGKPERFRRIGTGKLMRRRQFLRMASAAAGTGLLARARPGGAQSLAGKQIRLIVPFPAGGPTDIVARPLAQMLGEALKATFVIDNRAGAGGSIGTEAVARSAPDGQTLLMGTVGTQAINPALYRNLPYDAVRDFTPVALVVQAPVAVVVHPAQ